MWLRRLEVKDLAGIASAVINLKPGVNVLCGPNELGKSSLVRAIRAALLLPSAAAAVDELRDWHVDAPPYVSLTIEESPGRVWRIQKRFGGGPDGLSLFEFSKNGNDFQLDARGREVGGKPFEVKVGSVLYIPSNMIHSGKATSSSTRPMAAAGSWACAGTRSTSSSPPAPRSWRDRKSTRLNSSH